MARSGSRGTRDRITPSGLTYSMTRTRTSTGSALAPTTITDLTTINGQSEPWSSLLRQNTPGALPAEIPVFIAQGETDVPFTDYPANFKVNADPAAVNREPYGAGWLFKLKLSNPDEAKSLLGAAAYEKISAD